MADQRKPATTAPEVGGTTYADDLRLMTDRAFCASQRYTDQQGRANREGADPRILEFERKLIRRARNLGVPLFAHCVIRGSHQQTDLFLAGRSKAKAGESPHNYGCAVDIIHGTKGWALTERQWAVIGHIGKELAMQAGLTVTWGGDWKFWDPAHWELTDWRATRDLYADGEDWDGRT